MVFWYVIFLTTQSLLACGRLTSIFAGSRGVNSPWHALARVSFLASRTWRITSTFAIFLGYVFQRCIALNREKRAPTEFNIPAGRAVRLEYLTHLPARSLSSSGS